MALTREKILETSFEVLRQFGLADLSMRRLATELGVAPGALYYHVHNKQELLSHLASRMLHQVLSAISGKNETGADLLISACRELYHQLVPVKESAEVIRLAIALHPYQERPGQLDLLDTFEHEFEILAPPVAALAARTLLHLALSCIEEEQTRAMLSGISPPTEPPENYICALEHLIAGFTTRSSEIRGS